MASDYRTLYEGLRVVDSRDTLAGVGDLSTTEREVIRLMRAGTKAKALPLITLQWVGNAWKIYESVLKERRR